MSTERELRSAMAFLCVGDDMGAAEVQMLKDAITELVARRGDDGIMKARDDIRAGEVVVVNYDGTVSRAAKPPMPKWAAEIIGSTWADAHGVLFRLMSYRSEDDTWMAYLVGQAGCFAPIADAARRRMTRVPAALVDFMARGYKPGEVYEAEGVEWSYDMKPGKEPTR